MVRVSCPICEKPVKMGAAKCPKCRFVLTVPNIVRHHIRKAWIFSYVICPGCRLVVSSTETECPECSASLLATEVVRKKAGRIYSGWRDYLKNASGADLVRLRLLFTAGSGLLLFILLPASVLFLAENYFKSLVVTIPVLAFMAFLALFLFPKGSIRFIFLSSTGIVRLGLIFNFFNLLIIVQCLASVFRLHVMLFSVLCVVCIVAMVILRKFMNHLVQDMDFYDSFRGNPQAQSFNHQNPQGRSARVDSD